MIFFCKSFVQQLFSIVIFVIMLSTSTNATVVSLDGKFFVLPTSPTCNKFNLDLCDNNSDCGDMGGYWYNNACNSSPFDPLVDNLTFPYTDRISFHRQRTGDLIALSNRSLWFIAGTHSSGYDVLDSHSITIYKNTNIVEPTSGERSDYYMYISNSSRSFYIEPIRGVTITAQDNIEFFRQSTGDLLALSDDSLWYIKSTHSNGYDVRYRHDLTIYTNTRFIPDINTSSRSSYYMYISGSGRGFFIEPLSEAKVFLKDNIEFHRQSTGDLLALSDGSLWYIKGTHSNGYDVRYRHDLTIYTNIQAIPDPNSGERSPYYMYISGSNRGFFVEPL
jgi:hypothetical protein